MNDKINSREEAESWDLELRPQSGWFNLQLRELWQYRDLAMLFVWRDFIAQYKQTILGPAWHIFQPLLTTLTFTVIFGQVARLSTDGLPQFLFYMAGTVLWTYFANCLTKTSTTFVTNAHLYGKVYFHRMVIPLSTVMSNLIAFGIQLGMFLLLLGWYVMKGSTVKPNWWILAFPFLVLLMAGFGLGLGIIVSALTTRYRDLSHLVTFGTQLMMYATPVIYPVSSVPEKYRWIVLANPLSSVVETFRFGFLGAGTVSPAQLLYSLAVMVVVMAIGMILFSRVEKTFMDTV